MSTFGIVSEFNPFHRGHAYLFEKAREAGADKIVCVMSANSVQRGELAITDKYTRARAALECGADLVLELPYPWCSASAEFFADAAVYVASFFCDTLFFGSERGNADDLFGAAKICESESFIEAYKSRIASGEGAGSVFGAILAENGYSSLGSNDLLGVSYIRAILKNKYNMDVRTTGRLGAAYNDETVAKGELPSASAVRNLLFDGNIDSALELLPAPSARLLRDAAERGDIVSNDEMLNSALLYFRLHSGEDFAGIAEIGGGLANRICIAAKDATNGAELVELAKTKVYTNARIKRAMLYCMTGVGDDIMKARPEYTLLLAANDKGRELLAKNRRCDGILVVTKPADAPQDSEQYKLSAKLDSVFTLACENKRGAGAMMKKSAYIG